jgi:hypothetical protein
MSLNGITFGGGISLAQGISVGQSGTAGVNNVTGYLEMNPPIIPGGQTEDNTATVNGTTGITINDSSATGIAVPALTVSNQNWFTANFGGGGNYTVTWGPGSTIPSSPIQVVQTNGALVFFPQNFTGPTTINFPWTFSV